MDGIRQQNRRRFRDLLKFLSVLEHLVPALDHVIKVSLVLLLRDDLARARSWLLLVRYLGAVFGLGVLYLPRFYAQRYVSGYFAAFLVYRGLKRILLQGRYCLFFLLNLINFRYGVLSLKAVQLLEFWICVRRRRKPAALRHGAGVFIDVRLERAQFLLFPLFVYFLLPEFFLSVEVQLLHALHHVFFVSRVVKAGV